MMWAERTHWKANLFCGLKSNEVQYSILPGPNDPTPPTTPTPAPAPRGSGQIVFVLVSVREQTLVGWGQEPAAAHWFC